MTEQEALLDMAYRRGYAVGTADAANRVKEAFKELPGTADMHVKDLLLDLYNEIMSSDQPS